MSCSACTRIPLDSHQKFLMKTYAPKNLDTSEVRVVSAVPERRFDGNVILFDDVRMPKKRMYKRMTSGKKMVELRSGDGKVLSKEELEFEPEKFYTLIVHEKDFFRLEDNLVCPTPGTSRLQIAIEEDLKKPVDIYLDDLMLFESAESGDFLESMVSSGIYDLHTSEGTRLEVELKSGNVYTVFLTEAPFVVENEYCINPI